jgi:hypothetical protein
MNYYLGAFDDAGVPVLITQESHRLAQGFAKQQPTPTKADQVYLNTLAVCTVNNYLKILGIAANLSGCDSWNPLMRSVINTADLNIVGVGRLECRPLLLTGLEDPDPVCHVPSEVQEDRIGYVVVGIDDPRQEATLLGFVDQVETEELLLRRLRSLSELPTYLHSLTSRQDPLQGVTRLSQWLDNLVDAGWRSLDDLLGLQPVAVQWRSATPDAEATSDRSAIARGKLLSFSDLSDERVALILEITPEADSSQTVTVRVCPTVNHLHLPATLRVMILDDEGSIVMQSDARADNRLIELEFSGDVGDAFSVKVELADQIKVESFVI